jgi:hypothetical protein
MAIIRKATPAEVDSWAREETASQQDLQESERLFASLPDRRGLSRMHYASTRPGWFARVYTRSIALARMFADEDYGGAVSALRAALDWRDRTRTNYPRQPRPSPYPRLQRVDRPEHKNVGWFAYLSRAERRYFSDSAHGGYEKSQVAAEKWLQDNGAAELQNRGTAEPRTKN